MRIPMLLLPGITLAFAAGCGGDPRPPVFPVTGQVNYDGKPVEGVHVFLFPINAPMPPVIPANPHALTGADGKFAMTTFAPDDGAPQGDYLVTLFWPDTTSGNEEEPDRFLGWYDAKHTKFKYTVKADPQSLPTFNLPKLTQPPQASAGIPGRN